ncbi:phage tail domain-containing protein [Bacillus swezeyi]|uniref:Phage tail family protein n=1 Tax=Bacillus swezeyi TaxID=1925020 RepID=A0A5M8RNS3_9BACI|nr:phage tail domain-containing protein [Bacillus swezeyi]KAA6447592.1 phage tail family protein [Bacillus swezeyi]TYS34173.1 phage tail family protein [Bacillus swezeyi]
MRDLIIVDKPISEILPGVSLLSFVPESPVFERQTVTMKNRNGLIMPRKKNPGRYRERKIVAEFAVEAHNAEQFDLYRSNLYSLLVNPDPYHVIHSYQPNKRWLVTADDVFSISQDNGKLTNSFSVTFTAVQGLAESVYDSTVPVNLQGERFNLGMNIGHFNEQPFQFKNKNRFSVYNFGDATLSPIEHDYKAQMYFEGKDIIITNITTGDSITLSGSYTKKNLLTVLKQYVFKGNEVISTRGRFPELAPGENEFSIDNAEYSDLHFITRFYYE